jgi:BASS family bile acid:Na+ symporter
MPVVRILFEIMCCLLLPLGLGMLTRRYLPAVHAKLGTICIRCSVVLLAIFIVGCLTSGRVDVRAYDWRTPAALIAFSVVSYYLCFPLGLLLRLRVDDMVTVGLEVVVRNAHLGILLKASLFPAVAGVADPIADGVLYVILFYGGVSIVFGGIQVIGRRVELRLYEARCAARAKKRSDEE